VDTLVVLNVQISFLLRFFWKYIRGVSIFYLRNKKQFNPQLAIIINIIGGVTALFTPP
jgi:ABC-type uncharacterized transport system permease subunit